MIKISNEIVEHEIIKVVDDFCKEMMIDVSINSDSCLGNINGITSQILVSVMGKLETLLNITIPNSVYIFYDKKSNKQLSVKEAAIKLIKKAGYGK